MAKDSPNEPSVNIFGIPESNESLSPQFFVFFFFFDDKNIFKMLMYFISVKFKQTFKNIFQL